MSIYAGLSLKDVYEERCFYHQCRPNSAILKWLPEIPDCFHTITNMDLSSNFVGPNGVLPLLEVVRCCSRLRTIDFRAQQLNKDSISSICGVLRRHPAVESLNLSDNPLNIAAGVSLLELVKENTKIKSLGVENTSIRRTVTDLLKAQLAKNQTESHARRHASKGEQRRRLGEESAADASPRLHNTNTTDLADAFVIVTLGCAASSPPLHVRTEHRAPDDAVNDFMRTLRSTVHPMLFDENPVPGLSAWLRANGWSYRDTLFAADDRDGCQCAARQRYGIMAWYRVAEAFPQASLLPLDDDTNTEAGSLTHSPLDLPRTTPEGFSWLFTSVAASMNHMPSGGLRECLLEPTPGRDDLGFYAAKLFIDGAWRYVVVDSFLPVGRDGNLIFTQPVQVGGTTYVWPCILEKVFAKLYGGYEQIDYAPILDEIVSPVERIPTVLPCPTKGRPPQKPSAQLPPCARTMADLTGGVVITRPLHTETFDSERWWATLAELFPVDNPKSTMAVAASRCNLDNTCGIVDSCVYQVLQVRHVGGVRLLQLCNAWAKSRWCGEWSQKSTAWLMFPDVEDMLSTPSDKYLRRSKANPNSAHEFHASATTTTAMEPCSASFWISYLDFLKMFEEMQVCRTFPECRERTVTGRWEGTSAGGSVVAHSWYRNPHYQLRVFSQDAFFINLTRLDGRFHQSQEGGEVSSEEYMATHVLQALRFPLCVPDDARVSLSGSGHDSGHHDGISTNSSSLPTTTCVLRTKYAAVDAISFEAVLAENTSVPYWIVPSRYGVGVEGTFILRVFSAGTFILSEESLGNHWREVTIDTEVTSSGENMSVDTNSQVVVHLSPPTGSPCYTLKSMVHSRTLEGSPHPVDTALKGVFVARAVLVPDDDEHEPAVQRYTKQNQEMSVSMFITHGGVSAEDAYSRRMGLCEAEDIICKGTPVAGGCVYAEAPASADCIFNLIGFLHPVQSRGLLQFTFWTSLPSLYAAVLPPWRQEVHCVEWCGSGSGLSYEATGNPQIEIYQVPPRGRFVVCMDMTSFSGTEPTIMITVLSNHERRGEGILGTIPVDRVMTRSQYVQDSWVQCEVELLDELLDSILIIPTLQPPGSTGTCRVTVLLESPNCITRTLSGGVSRLSGGQEEKL